MEKEKQIYTILVYKDEKFLTVAGCWAHMRRKFTDTLKALPKDVRERHPACKGVGLLQPPFCVGGEVCRKRALLPTAVPGPPRTVQAGCGSLLFLGKNGTKQQSRAKDDVWRGVGLCRKPGAVVDERIPGRAAGVIQ